MLQSWIDNLPKLFANARVQDVRVDAKPDEVWQRQSLMNILLSVAEEHALKMRVVVGKEIMGRRIEDIIKGAMIEMKHGTSFLHEFQVIVAEKL